MKLLTLQFLRGVAAIVVVAYHVHGLITKRASEIGAEHAFWLVENQFVKIGAIGVDVFFILSGFIIFYTSRHSSDLWLYVKKRVVRIYPIWFVAIFFMSVIAILPGTSAVFEWKHVLYSSLLMPHYTDGSLTPFLKVGWTLNYEILFYSLFGICFILTKNKRLELITSIIVCLWIFSDAIDSNLALFALLQNPILFEFVIGGWLARFYLAGFTITKIQMYILLLIALIWLSLFFYSTWLWHYTSLISRAPIAISIFIIAVFYCPIRDCKVPNLFIYLGDASYSIYLFHMFPIMVLSGVFKKIPIVEFLNIPTVIVWGVITFISILFGCIVYSLVERNLNLYMKRFVTK
ncbi:acyltransferase family protein [Psychromonas sp.]|uniref:acyltransferase family protein n=1 Tax=Psychromonas sp. TaxID=1884585 RepID=UPI003A981D37